MPDLTARSVLLVLLGVFAVGYGAFWFATWRRTRATATAGDPSAGSPRPGLVQTAIGFVTNFFDTLGIGSFAPTTSIYKFTRMVPDERIPGTMNVGHTLPVVVQALLYISFIDVDSLTLVTLIAAAVLGAWLGAGVVTGLPRRPIQIGMGFALLIAAVFMTMTQLELYPGGGEALGLHGGWLVVAVVGSVVFGALNAIGIGFYAPCMIMIALLGMNPKAAFPIMMGSCAFLMPVTSARFLRRRRFSLRPAIGLTLGGIPAVLAAALLVKSLPLDTVRWLVVIVVVLTAMMMLRSAKSTSR